MKRLLLITIAIGIFAISVTAQDGSVTLTPQQAQKIYGELAASKAKDQVIKKAEQLAQERKEKADALQALADEKDKRIAEMVKRIAAQQEQIRLLTELTCSKGSVFFVIRWKRCR